MENIQNKSDNEKVWFNIQGKFLIKTTYNTTTGKYYTNKMPWNLLPFPKK